MVNEKLTEYMEKVSIKNKDISEYVDEEKGIMYIIPTGQLFPNLQYLELTEDELKNQKFEMLVDKNLKYNTIKKVRPVLNKKKKASDPDIIDKEVDVYQIWNITNGLNIKESFNNKELAIKTYKDIRKRVGVWYE